MRRSIVLVIIILSVFATLAVSGMVKKSATCDEIAHHIPSGYVFLTKGDLRFDTSAPPLARYIASFPMMFMGINMPDNESFWRREDRGEFGRAFFRMNMDKYENILLFGRIMILIVS